jgi:hypothetical protein
MFTDVVLMVLEISLSLRQLTACYWLLISALGQKCLGGQISWRSNHLDVAEYLGVSIDHLAKGQKLTAKSLPYKTTRAVSQRGSRNNSNLPLLLYA